MIPSLTRLLHGRRPTPVDRDAETIIQSPLNDPATIDRIFGAGAPDEPWHRRYFALEVEARPALTPFFDPAYYRQTNPDVALARLDPYLHFLWHGLGEGRSPHPLIDVAFMRQQLERSGAEPSIDAPRLAELLRDNAISPHPMFDVGHYLGRYPDVAESGTSALLHFITHGAEEGRTPHGGFDPDAAVRNHPGISRYEAFLHHAAAVIPVVREAGAATTEGVRGVFDGVDAQTAQGWAFDPKNPSARLEIEILEGDRVVARGRADRLREDLRRAGVGDGRCHFRLPVSSELRDGAPHRLVARAVATGTLLQGNHQLVCRVRASTPYDLLPLAEARAMARRIGKETSSPRLDRYLEELARCSLLIETGQGAAAVHALEQLADRYPGNPVTDLKLGEACLEAGDPAAAIVAFGRIDPRGPLAAWSLLGMGNASRLLEHWSEAEAFYVQARAIAPQLPHPGRRLRQLAFRQARDEAARLAEAGDRRAAVARLVPELISNPGDPGVCDMVAALMDSEARNYDDPLVNRANNAWRLLGIVAGAARERRERGH